MMKRSSAAAPVCALALGLWIPATETTAQAACTGTTLLASEWEVAGVMTDMAWGLRGTGRGGMMDLLIAEDLVTSRYMPVRSLTEWTSGERNPGPFQICAGGELTMAAVGDDTFYGLGAGGGVGWGTGTLAAFALPMVGYAGGLYTKVYTGGSARLGRFILGVEAAMPLMTEFGGPALALRLGFTLGDSSKDTPPVAAPPPPAPVAPRPTPMPTAAPPVAGVQPYALDDVEAMVRNDVPTARILELAGRACVSFRMNDAAETRLRRVGSDPELVIGLRQVCYSAD